MKTMTFVLLGVALATGAVRSQAPPSVPKLAIEQRQAIQIVMQRMEIAQLQFDKANIELRVLVLSLQKEGYNLDLQTMEYVPRTPAK